jgi:4-aminobutyrate aminotransferase-like enzyme
MFEDVDPKDLEEGRKYLMSGSVGGGLTIIVESGKGAVLKDSNGKEYIDCTSQAWTFNIGMSHPRVIEAVTEQINKITHVRTSFETVPKLLALKKIGEVAPADLKKISSPICKLFSGFMEHFIRIPNAYCYRCPLGQDYPKCGLLCAEYVKTMIERGCEPVIAIILEPFQASGGMIGFPDGYLKRLREICDEFGIILIFDEIQTGFGRLGSMFACDKYGVYPDILTYGKAIAGGFPLAGVMQKSSLKPPEPATDSFTFAHFPVSLAAAIATLDVMKEEKLVERAKAMGEYFTSRLKDLQKKYEIIGDIRGPGLMIGIELVKDRKTKEKANDACHSIVKESIEDGVIFGESKFKGIGNVLKIKPPFVISEAQADRVLEVFEKHIKKQQDKL